MYISYLNRYYHFQSSHLYSMQKFALTFSCLSHYTFEETLVISCNYILAHIFKCCKNDKKLFNRNKKSTFHNIHQKKCCACPISKVSRTTSCRTDFAFNNFHYILSSFANISKTNIEKYLYNPLNIILMHSMQYSLFNRIYLDKKDIHFQRKINTIFL